MISGADTGGADLASFADKGESERRLRSFWPGEVSWDVSLAGYTTFRVGGPARALVMPGDRMEVVSLVNGCRREEIPWAVMGGGSNLLVPDAGFPGVIILLGRRLAAINPVGKDAMGRTLVEVEAGRSLAGLLNWCEKHELSGLEFAAGIPGTVGGAVVMNAGAWDLEIKDVLSALCWLEGAEVISRGRAELDFTYRCWQQRTSDSVVLSATFALEAGDGKKIEECRLNYAESRKIKQPVGQASAGSFFKNPGTAPAGRLIEEAGLKGTRIGGAMVSELHANFIVNTGGARATDIIQLAHLVRARVEARSGVRLEPEVLILGDDWQRVTGEG